MKTVQQCYNLWFCRAGKNRSDPIPEWRAFKAGWKAAKRNQLPIELKDLDATFSDAIRIAWDRYVEAFGEAPHGTTKQLRALLELLPRRITVIKTTPPHERVAGSP